MHGKSTTPMNNEYTGVGITNDHRVNVARVLTSARGAHQRPPPAQAATAAALRATLAVPHAR